MTLQKEATLPAEAASVSTVSRAVMVYYLAPEFIDLYETDWLALIDTDIELFELAVIKNENTLRMHVKVFENQFNNGLISDEGFIIIK
jgi:hypothetical protein